MQNLQNQFKMNYFYVPTFWRSFWGGDATPHMTRKIFLVKPVHNLYLGKVSERRLLVLLRFVDARKGDRGSI